jgi:CheY-like chemotaxis protein
MKIKYNILWLDDQISNFVDDGWVEKINHHLIDEGFEPNIITIAKTDEFFLRLNDSFDVILTDFHMAEKNGDEVVKEIRAKSIQTEILFYTAQADLQAIGKIDRVTFVETIDDHYAEVTKATTELIDLTVKKFQHIISMRGMIMHETSILDDQTSKILFKYVDSTKCTASDTILDSICTRLEMQLKDKQSIIANIQNTGNLKKLMKDTFLFSAEYKIEALKNILQDLTMTDFTGDYKTEVISLRNKFAHAVLETDVNGRQYFKSGDDGITFDEALCKIIRKNINKHKNNIDNLEKNLKKYLES